jgi:hypothetical protein
MQWFAQGRTDFAGPSLAGKTSTTVGICGASAIHRLALCTNHAMRSFPLLLAVQIAEPPYHVSKYMPFAAMLDCITVVERQVKASHCNFPPAKLRSTGTFTTCTGVSYIEHACNVLQTNRRCTRRFARSVLAIMVWKCRTLGALLTLGRDSLQQDTHQHAQPKHIRHPLRIKLSCQHTVQTTRLHTVEMKSNWQHTRFMHW